MLRKTQSQTYISNKRTDDKRGKWLFHGSIHSKDKQLQSMDTPVKILFENISFNQRSSIAISHKNWK